MEDVPERGERGAPSSLRGRLSGVYMPGITAGPIDQLVRRLGERATVDDPIFGRTSGMPALARFLEEVAAWMGKHQAAFEETGYTTGSDRDVSEGTLLLSFGDRRVRVPVAVMVERRREREVEVRLYYSTRPIRGTRTVRSAVLPQNDEVSVPPPVQAHLDALARGDVGAIMGSFESGATMRDAGGVTHAKEGEAGPLRAFYEALFAGGGGIEVLKGARADDGRTCALEYTVVRVRGKLVPPQAGLAVYERGESGLLRAVRIYEDVEV